jgi:precorrin-3B synthase
LCADPRLAGLPGRFLFVLDDGRGDLMDRHSDAGLVALSSTEAQLRIGEHWGAVIDVNDAAERLAALAGSFQSARGDGPDAPWHVRELPGPLALGERVHPADARLPALSGPLPYGPVPGGTHVQMPGGVLTRARTLPAAAEFVVTPWHGIFVPA